MEPPFSAMAPTNVVLKPMAPVRAHQPRANPGARAGNTYIADGVVFILDVCSNQRAVSKNVRHDSLLWAVRNDTMLVAVCLVNQDFHLGSQPLGSLQS